jgi:tetratricopeptide (TPR) repeat protein
VVLALGAALGATDTVDRHLRELPDAFDDLLTALGTDLGSRALLVDGWDVLGSMGVERELSLALAPRTRAIRSWLDKRSGLFMCRSWMPRDTEVARLPADPPVALMNGVAVDTAELWRRLGNDRAAFSLVLALLALGTDEGDVDGLSEHETRSRIVELLPVPAARMLHLLAVHGRPLSLAHAGAMATPEALQLGYDMGLWSQVSDALVAEAGWSEFVEREMPRSARRALHLDLANAFMADFRPGDATESRAGLSVLEAHRHLVAAGEVEQAREYWRYGATLLIEAARERSLSKDYATAAAIYGQVVQAVSEERLPVPQRLRAYARHYLHFNRAHGKMEGFAATARGYREAIAEWPENALFWSRLVRVECIKGRLGAALGDLEEAQRLVEPHKQKQTVLIARTVRGLLDHGRLLDAILIWGSYQPDTPAAVDVADAVRAHLERGWRTARLVIEHDEPLVFVREVEVRVVRGGGRWSAELPSLRAFGEGASPAAALRDLIRRVRSEAERLLRAYTPDLSSADRFAKRLLLGLVDVTASRVDAPSQGSYWYFGTLERDDNGLLWLRTGGGRDLWFQIPEDLAQQLTVDDLPRLALVEAVDGVPTGPVVALEPAWRGSDEDLWEAWRKLQADER